LTIWPWDAGSGHTLYVAEKRPMFLIETSRGTDG
jgi:hypothetical protein